MQRISDDAQPRRGGLPRPPEQGWIFCKTNGDALIAGGDGFACLLLKNALPSNAKETPGEGFLRKNSLSDYFSYLPALLQARDFRALRSAPKGFAPRPHRLLKKAGENLFSNYLWVSKEPSKKTFNSTPILYEKKELCYEISCLDVLRATKKINKF